MLSIVHTCEGWMLRDAAGRDVLGPFRSSFDAEAERVALSCECHENVVCSNCSGLAFPIRITEPEPAPEVMGVNWNF